MCGNSLSFGRNTKGILKSPMKEQTESPTLADPGTKHKYCCRVVQTFGHVESVDIFHCSDVSGGRTDGWQVSYTADTLVSNVDSSTKVLKSAIGGTSAHICFQYL
jgi:hypothetical protein